MLVAVVAILAIGAAFLVPRPGDGVRAVPPSTWSPVPQGVLTPVLIEPPSRAGALESPAPTSGRWRPRRPEAGLTAATDPEHLAIGTPWSPIQPPPATRPIGPTHVVVAGDNLWTIAQRHSAPLAAIMLWNDGVDPERLVAGQRILVPGGSKMRAAQRSAARKSAARKSSAPRPPAPNATKLSATRAPSPARSTGDHLWPLAIRGTISRAFSAAHPGLDIAAPAGTSVRAIAQGSVTWAGWKANGGGYVVVIRHPGGMRSTYNHNSKVLVEVGETVERGQTIAQVGSTGWSTGPHLDVRIEMGGRFVNPMDIY